MSDLADLQTKLITAIEAIDGLVFETDGTILDATVRLYNEGPRLIKAEGKIGVPKSVLGQTFSLDIGDSTMVGDRQNPSLEESAPIAIQIGRTIQKRTAQYHADNAIAYRRENRLKSVVLAKGQLTPYRLRLGSITRETVDGDYLVSTLNFVAQFTYSL